MNEKYGIIHVTSYLDPGNFWFLWDDEIENRNIFHLKLRNYGKFHLFTPQVINDEKILVKYGDQWARAKIVNIRPHNLPKQEYICWLIDYGLFVEVSKIYQLPDEFKLNPEFAKKGILYGIRSVIQDYNFETGKIEERLLNDWVPGVQKHVINLLNDPDITQTFRRQYTINDYEVGNLFINTKLGGKFDINDKIIGLGLAKLDEFTFTSELHKQMHKPLHTIYISLSSLCVKEDSRQSCQEEVLKIPCGRGAFRKVSNLQMNTKVSDINNSIDFDDSKFAINIKNKPEKQSSFIVENKKPEMASPPQSYGRGKSLLQKIRKNSVSSSASMSSNSDCSERNANLTENINKSIVKGEIIDSNIGVASYVVKTTKGRGFSKSIEIAKNKNQIIDDDFTKFEDFEEKSLKPVSAVPEFIHANESNEAISSCGSSDNNSSYSFDRVQSNKSSSKTCVEEEILNGKSLPFSAGRGFSTRAKIKLPKVNEEIEIDEPISSSSSGDERNSNVQSKFACRGFSSKSFKSENDELKHLVSDISPNLELSKNNFENITDANNSPSNKDCTNIVSRGRGFLLKVFEKNEQGILSDANSSKTSDKVFEDAVENTSVNSASMMNKNINVDVIDILPAGVQLSSQIYMKNLSKTNSNKSSNSASRSWSTNSNISSEDTASASNAPNPRKSAENFRKTSNKERPPEYTESISNNEVFPSNQSETNKSPFCQENKTDSSGITKLVTGRCECSICESWRDNTSVFKPYEEPIPPQPKIKIITKPELLFRTAGEEIQSRHQDCKLHAQLQTKTDRLIEPLLLLHGYFVTQPATELYKVAFHSDVQQQLRKLNYEKAFRIQTYAWPVILRGHHIVVVSGPETGKTMTYVPALCTFLLQGNPEWPDCVGPVAIVICPGVKTAEHVYKITATLLSSRRNKIVWLAVPPLLATDKYQILQGVDILICTPNSLINLLKEKIISLKRLSQVALEDTDTLLENFPEEMAALFNIFQKTLIRRTYNQSIQMIAIAQQWSLKLERFAKTLEMIPYVLIGAFLEGALYGRADITTNFIDSSAKPSSVVKIIKDNSSVLKTVIVSNNIGELEEVVNYLSANGIPYEMLHEHSSYQDYDDVRKRWILTKSGNYFVLLCTDHALNTELSITDASIVIQYSLPETWSHFVFRFSCFMNNYRSPLITHENVVHSCKMRIYVDETNLEQIPRIVQFLQRLRVDLSETILSHNNNIIHQSEKLKIEKNIQLCNELLLFGSCRQSIICQNRHALSTDLDISSTIPQSGIIKFKILHIKKATIFYARLLEYIDSDGQTHSIDDHYSEIAVQMNKLTNTKKPVLDVNIGSLCAVEEMEGVFRRCKVIEIKEMGKLRRAFKVLVHLLDTGGELIVHTTKLYLLPEHLYSYPPEAIKIYVANMGPPEKDSVWSQQCVNQIQKLFQKHGFQNANCLCMGRIKLQLGNSLFVDNLELKEYLDGDLVIDRLSLRHSLVKHKLAEPRPEHLEKLYNLCTTYNFNLPNYNLPVVKTMKLIQPQPSPSWAHLENFQEFNQVYFTQAYTPDHFYVRLSKNQDLFDQLNKEIETEMDKPLKPDFEVIEGRCYFAKDPRSGDYGRIIVTKLIDDSAECFFVDFGDKITLCKKEIQFLPDELIVKLPFQAIECKLWGLNPSGKEWLSESIDILYDYAYETNTEEDLLRLLHVKVMGEEMAKLTSSKCYSVLLVDIQNDTIINNIFCEMNHAIRTTENEFYVDFEQFKLKPSEEVDDDNEEQVDKEENYFEEDLEESSDSKWDYQIFHPELFIKKAEEYIPNKESSTSYTPKMKALPATDYSTPNIIWKQTKDVIMLRVEITNVTDYNLRIIRNKILFFKTCCRNITYKFDLNLYGKVESKTEDSITGFHVSIKLKKQISDSWPRLITNTEKLRYIKADLSAIEVDTDPDDEQLPLQVKFEKWKQFGKTQYGENGPYIYEIGSDGDYSESDIETDHDSDNDNF